MFPNMAMPTQWVVIMITPCTCNQITWLWGTGVHRLYRNELLCVLSYTRPLIMWWLGWKRSLDILVTTKYERRYRLLTRSILGRFLSVTPRPEMSKFCTLSEDCSLSELFIVLEICIEFHLVLWDVTAVGMVVYCIAQELAFVWSMCAVIMYI